MSHAVARPVLMPIGDIADLLAQHAEALAADFLRGGRRDGGTWRAGSIGGEAGPSLCVGTRGTTQGQWHDFAAGRGGDMLDLAAACRFGGDMKEALRWARAWLGLDNIDPASFEIRQAQAAEDRAARAAEAEAQAEQKRRAAMRIWLEARPSIYGTPVEQYLAGRGIDLAELGRQPRSIRYHPALWCQEAEARLPAMVTGINRAGVFAAVHRTWLEQAGPGDWRKARLTQAKKVLGAFAGGCIPLWRGASGRPLAEAPLGETADLVEGIEDGLSVALAAPEARVLAAISLSNMGAVLLPPAITAVRLWRENDDSNAAILAFDRATSAHLAAGRQVLVPDVPAGFKDVNDMLRGQR